MITLFRVEKASITILLSELDSENIKLANELVGTHSVGTMLPVIVGAGQRYPTWLENATRSGNLVKQG